MESKKLWKRAIQSIPGGNGLLSKRPDRYAPDIWPTYFSKAKGISIWDLEGNKYKDMAQMGIGTAILGYSDDDVDNILILCSTHQSKILILINVFTFNTR